MKRRRMLFRSLAIAALVGTVMASALSLLLLTAGFLMGGFQPERALAAARSGLLVIGALGLFICAGLLLTRIGRNRIPADTQWMRCPIDFVPISAIVSVLILLTASAVDYFLYISIV